MKKSILGLAVFLLLLAAPLAAQTIEDPAVTPEIILAIIGGTIFGIPLSGLVEVVKRTLIKIFKITNVKPWLGYVSSSVVVAVLTIVTLAGLNMLSVQNALTAGFLAWLVANGFYKVTVKAAAERLERNG